MHKRQLLGLLLATLVLLALAGTIKAGGLVKVQARVKVAGDAVEYRRKQVELYPAGLWMYAYEHSYKPLAPVGRQIIQSARSTGAEAPLPAPKPRRAGVSAKANAPGKKTARTTPVEATTVPSTLDAWYRLPVEQRWAQYQSIAWEPVRIANRA